MATVTSRANEQLENLGKNVEGEMARGGGENGGGVSTIHTRENNVNEVNGLFPCCLHSYDCNLDPNSVFYTLSKAD